MKEYNLVVCGGTFDHFHKGHKAFLRFGFNLSENALIGITSDRFVAKHKDSSSIAPYSERQKAVTAFLQEEDFLHRAEILPIDTIFIPKQWERLLIEAIVITDDSVEGASAINEDRKKRGLATLPIELFRLTVGQDGLSISASRIREGRINREGELFVSPDWLSQTFLLPEALRSELKQPIGEIIDFAAVDFSTTPMEKAVTVGDVTAKLFHDSKLFPIVSVVDFMVKRKKIYASLSELGFDGSEKIYIVTNPPGQITGDLLQTVQEIFTTLHQENHRSVIRIEGEEDLAVLPVVLAAPLGLLVFYGQPDVGIVRVVVTEDLKQELHSLLMRFQRDSHIR